MCLLMHQIHVGRCPSYLAALVSLSADTETPKPRTILGERAFSFCGPAEWNSLPSELQTITDTTSFKKKLEEHFYNQAFCVD